MANHQKRAQMPGYQGNIYQTKLLMLYLQRGLKKNQNFELGTEIGEAHKFDDLVFKYTKVVDGRDKDHFIILQSKHKTTLDAKITYKDIFTNANTDFGLVKYYNAFKKAKNETLFKDGVIEHAIIYTNTNFDLFEKIPEKDVNWGKLKNISNITNRIKVDQDDGLSLCKIEGCKYYRFKTDLVLPVLKSLLSIYHIIAQKLIKVLTNDKNSLSGDDEILKHYDCLLETEVIDINKKTFRKEFIEEVGNDTGRQKLRNALNDVAKDENLSLDDIINNKLNITRTFGKKKVQQNWPENFINTADIVEFLKTFVFATGQPDEDELGKIILSELGDLYSTYDADLIYSYLAIEIQDWMIRGNFGYNTSKNSSESRFISSQDATEFFKKTKRKFNKFLLKGPTTQYNSYFERYIIEFDDINFKNYIKTFLTSNIRILSIISEHIIISSIKLYKELTNTIELNEFIYVRLSSLNDNVIDAFESKLTDHLLVIELDLDKTKCDNWMEKISETIDAIQNSNEKKLIIISNKKKILENILPADIKFDEINDDANTLKNLTQDSQKCFLDTDIKFQGCDVKLSNLISNDSLKNIINGEILLKILNNENIEIGKEVDGLKDERTYYIKRKFTCVIKNGGNLYLLSEMNERDLCLETQNLEVIEKPELITKNECDVFERASKENGLINVYILRKTYDAFILLKKSKDSFEITNFKNIINCQRDKCELNLISAIAGMGKSTLFTYLSEKIKEYNPTSWVIKIYLNAVSSKLKTMNDQDMQFEDVIDFLHYCGNQHTKLEKSIFKHFLQMGNVFLYLDAFDEICPYYKKVVLKIIEKLRENANIKKIWISTRPHDSIIRDLKVSINGIPLKHYSINPFTGDDQRKYLKNYWKQSIELNEDRFEVFVNELFEFLKTKIDDRRFEFLGIALHTKMVGVTLKKSFEEFQKSDLSETNKNLQKIMKTLQLSELYEKFIQNKSEIHWLHKNRGNLDTVASRNSAEDMYKKFLKQTKILALDYLFEKEQLIIFLTQEDIENLEKYKIKMKNNGDELGIVDQIIDNKPNFIHRTFAEYFTAAFLLDILGKEDKKSLEIIDYFLKCILNYENTVICRFMNSMMKSKDLKQNSNYENIIKELDGEILYFIIKNNWQNIAIWLLKNGNNVDYKIQKTNVLHLACALQNSEMNNELIKTILEKLKTEKKLMPFIIEKNHSNGNIPLNVAVENDRLDNIICMLNIYKEEQILDSAFTDRNKSGKNIFHLAANQTCDDDTFIYLLKFASSDPPKLKPCFLKTDNSGDTPLFVAAYYGQLNKLKATLEFFDDQEIVDSLFTNVNRQGRNVLHQVATSVCDFATFNYVMKFVSSDSLKNYLLKTDNDGDTPLILAAYCAQFNKLDAVLDSNVDSEIIDSIFINASRIGQNVFHRAANRTCDSNTFVFLLKLASSDPAKLRNYLTKTDISGKTPLIVAVAYGQLKKLKAVLDSNIDPEIIKSVFNSINRNGENIFHLAVTRDCDYDTFDYLLRFAICDPVKLKNYFLKKDNSGDTPLTSAAYNGQLRKLKALLDPDVNSEISNSVFVNLNRYGQNVFHLAATSNCDYDTFDYLLKFAINEPVMLKSYFLKTDNNGHTPLIIAAHNGELKKLKSVLDSNVDPEILSSVFDNVNWNGENVFHQVLSKFGDNDTLIYLLKLASSDPVKLLKFFSKTDNWGYTPLAVAEKKIKLSELKAALSPNFNSEIVDIIFQDL